MSASTDARFQWLRTGDEAYAAMLSAIDEARVCIRLETYIYEDSPLGRCFRDALLRARARGLRVQVLVDAFGSLLLPDEFWQPLLDAGGEFCWFNPLTLRRLHFRDHRKLLVCDDYMAFIGGFNISPECEGDGIAGGWRDHGLAVHGPLVGDAAASFDEMFQRADFRHKRFTRLRRNPARKQAGGGATQWLFSGPGRGKNPIARALLGDLAGARDVAIAMAYFLPTWRMRRALTRVARRGGRVRLLLPGKSDVPLSKLASQSLYRRLLRAGVEIHEYQPQVLHTKLLMVDGATYVGSSNLDPRSLHINYELMLRTTDAGANREARALFEENLAHSRRIQLAEWRRCRTYWTRLKSRIAHFLLVRVDPHLANWQLKHLR